MTDSAARPPNPPDPKLPPARRRPPPLRPSFTLTLIYVVVFFVAFAMLLILPELIPILEMQPGPEQEDVAKRVAEEAPRIRLLYALLLALGAVGLGSYLKVLPGLRR